jgi:RNA binding exosome subunit
LKGPIQSVEVSYFLHATEDSEKVDAAVVDFLGMACSPETEKMEGHFGNAIVDVRFRLTGEEASRALENMVAKLPRELKNELAGGIAGAIDEHSALYLRFDKQKLVLGAVAAGGSDPVRVRVKPRSYLVRGRPGEFYANLLGRGG